LPKEVSRKFTSKKNPCGLKIHHFRVGGKGIKTSALGPAAKLPFSTPTRKKKKATQRGGGGIKETKTVLLGRGGAGGPLYSGKGNLTPLMKRGNLRLAVP